jgi:hypothetical protein
MGQHGMEVPALLRHAPQRGSTMNGLTKEDHALKAQCELNWFKYHDGHGLEHLTLTHKATGIAVTKEDRNQLRLWRETLGELRKKLATAPLGGVP